MGTSDLVAVAVAAAAVVAVVAAAVVSIADGAVVVGVAAAEHRMSLAVDA